MKQVKRSELLDYQSYEDNREAFRSAVMEQKARRRIHVGDYLTLLLENPLTIRYQIQEMMRAEKIVRESDIKHELDTYNAILGGKGELGCTLLIELDDPGERAIKLREWYALPEHVHAVLGDGTRIKATFDPSQRGVDRLSSVQYLKFSVGRQVPVSFEVDHPGIKATAALTEDQRAAIAEDLATDA
jgi:hypothetical protein